MRLHFLVAVLALAATFAVTLAGAAEPLPPLAQDGAPNGYRGNAQVIPAGQSAYQTYCAACHGDDATHPMAEAPDLRRLNGFCKRLKDAALAERCLKDVDSYFLFSVREGKVRAGVVHMPPWKEVLTPQEIWAIRSFTETRPLDPPRRVTSVDAARQAQAAASAPARRQ